MEQRLLRKATGRCAGRAQHIRPFHCTKLHLSSRQTLQPLTVCVTHGRYTYPRRPPDEGPSEYQTIPLSKIEDFGVHAKQYYSLDISFFKSSLDSHMMDLLWNK